MLILEKRNHKFSVLIRGVSVPERFFGTEREFISCILFLSKQIQMAFSVLENENAFAFPGTHLAFHVSRSRTGPRHLYHVPFCNK